MTDKFPTTPTTGDLHTEPADGQLGSERGAMVGGLETTERVNPPSAVPAGPLSREERTKLDLAAVYGYEAGRADAEAIAGGLSRVPIWVERLIDAADLAAYVAELRERAATNEVWDMGPWGIAAEIEARFLQPAPVIASADVAACVLDAHYAESGRGVAEEHPEIAGERAFRAAEEAMTER